MRAVISFAALILALGSLLVLGDPAFAQDGESNETSTAEPTDEAEKAEASDKPDAVKAAWAQVFAPPDAHRWEFGAGAGWLMDETAYGDTEAEGYFRAEGRRLLGEYLSTALAVDFWRQAPTAGPLEFRTRHIGLTGSFGVHHWFGRWLLGADARAGAHWINRTIGDSSGTGTDSSRLDPSLGAAARAGFAVFGVVSVAVEGELRWRPQRLDRVVLFQVGWLTGWAN